LLYRVVLLQLLEATLKYITENENLIEVAHVPTVLAFLIPLVTGSATVVADFLTGLLTYFPTEAFGMKFTDWSDNDRFNVEIVKSDN
jgi:hypothetical protein